MTEPLDPRVIVTIKETAITNMVEIEALNEVFNEKGFIMKDHLLE